jgi:hypothetical protein
MAAHSGKNEGFRLLEELVCQAIPDLSLFGPQGASSAGGRGVNSGMQVWEELALDAAGGPSQRGAPPDGSTAVAGERTTAGTSLIEIVIDRDFASYTAAEQERLLSAIKHLLVVSGDVRVVRRVFR